MQGLVLHFPVSVHPLEAENQFKQGGLLKIQAVGSAIRICAYNVQPHNVTQHHECVGSTSSSYSASLALKSQSGVWLSRLKFFPLSLISQRNCQYSSSN